MLLDLPSSYYVLIELICQDKYKKIQLTVKHKKCHICQHYQLCVITEKPDCYADLCKKQTEKRPFMGLCTPLGTGIII